MDLHCHLATTEVIGYLAGKFDAQQRRMVIVQAFPCRALEPGPGNKREKTVEMDPVSEMDVRVRIDALGLNVVGWYHSHPVFRPEPSIRDIENQQRYQKLFKTGEEDPFVGFIVAPFDKGCVEGDVSLINCFWVAMQSSNPDALGTPMKFEYARNHDLRLEDDVLQEVWALLRYYGVYQDRILMSKIWRQMRSKAEKLSNSLRDKLPSSMTEAHRGALLDCVVAMIGLSDKLHEDAVAAHRARYGLATPDTAPQPGGDQDPNCDKTDDGDCGCPPRTPFVPPRRPR